MEGTGKIKVGIRILHPTYGLGFVLSVTLDGTECNIGFGKDQRDVHTLKVTDVLANCRILSGEEDPDEEEPFPDFGTDPEQTGEEAAEEPWDEEDWEDEYPGSWRPIPRRLSEEEQKKLLEQILDRFRGNYCMTETGIRELNNFFTFRCNYAKPGSHRSRLEYNLLVRCDDPDEQMSFIKDIGEALFELGLAARLADVENLVNFSGVSMGKADDILHIEEMFADGTMIGIHNCVPAPVLDTLMTTNYERSETVQKRNRIISLWKFIETCAADDPECTIVAAGSGEFYRYMKDCEESYRFLFHHGIYLFEMSAEEVMKRLEAGIHREGLRLSKEFRNDLTQYVRSVYPKAFLRNGKFVKDLLHQILDNRLVCAPNSRDIPKECVPYYRQPRDYDEITADLNSLVGLEKVKEEIRKLNILGKEKKKGEKLRLNFIFEGNPGTGKTTVAHLMADLLYDMGLISKNNLVIVNRQDVNGPYIGWAEERMRQKLDESKGGVLFIDEAYFLFTQEKDAHSSANNMVTMLTSEMEDHAEERVVILAGYTEDMEKLLKDSNSGWASRIPYKFEFEDYSVGELEKILRNLAEKDDFAIAPDADEALRKLIEAARTEKNFGNARAIENLYRQQLRLQGLERGDRTIRKQDIEEIMPKPLHDDLDTMIGLEGIKESLNDFEDEVRYKKMLTDSNRDLPRSTMHMMFTGNPGTGKTTVAYKIADCLYRMGVLKTNRLVISERKDLVSSHVGETAQKTDAKIREALDGVLFIDEAYSLYKPGGNDPGSEAIETLITAMETYKERLIVIFAGYPREMDTFLEANPGIRSRIAYYFNFPDYSVDELLEMYCYKMQKNGFLVSANAKKKVKKTIRYFSRAADFGNGRFIDRLMERTIKKRSKRKPYDFSIWEKDVPSAEEMGSVYGQRTVWTEEDLSEEQKKKTAVHEVGHALVSMYSDPPSEVELVTIVNELGALGYTKYKLRPGSANRTESECKARLASLFGGRNAEKLLYGEHDSGCISDYERARELAEQMVKNFAMGEIGKTTPDDLLREADAKATEILEAHREELKLLSDKLYEKKNLTGKEIAKITKDIEKLQIREN